MFNSNQGAVSDMNTRSVKRKSNALSDGSSQSRKAKRGPENTSKQDLASNSSLSHVKTETEDTSVRQSNNHKIIVGIDYGTTYTGVSYVGTDKSDINDIVVISTWPGPDRDTETVFKAPSRIAYPFNNPGLQENKWGFQVEGGMVAYSWTKLLLDHSTAVSEFDEANLNSSIGMGVFKLPEDKDAITVAADFLTSVYKHTLSVLEKQISAGALAITPIEFWFTMPAIWSDQAQKATRDAAMLAGFASRPADQIFMITEPEAAAIATLKKNTTNSLSATIKPGDGILICDCGGGTVDITTYVITTVYPKLAFEELCTGIGGKCGSSSIDRELYNLMSKRFGTAFDKLPARRKSPGSEFMRAFERIKRDFGYSSDNRIYELPLNMNVKNADPEYFDDDERLVKLTVKDVRHLFDPVVEKIIALVRRQLTAANGEAERSVITQIVLVGGFGDSEFLRKALSREFAPSDYIQITVPEYPQAAIVRGAALRGLEGIRPTTRRCRRHYGFAMGIPFREGIDSEEHSYDDPFTGEKMVSGIMQWSIGKGEKVVEDAPLKKDLRQTFRASDPGVGHTELYSCSLDDAPGRHDHPRITLVGRIRSDFSGVSASKLERKINHEGKQVCRVRFHIEVLLGAKEGILRFQTVVDGEIIGKTDIDFGKD